MDDIKIVLTIVIGVVVAIAFPVGCTMHRQALIAEAIGKGADPIAAKCAIEGEVDSTRQSGMYLAKALEKVIQR
jgi:hypothetical protein